MADREQIIGVLLTVIVASAVGFVGLATVQELEDSTEVADSETFVGMKGVNADGVLAFDRQVEQFHEVKSSSGFAVELTGAPDSEISGTADLDTTADEWEVCSWTRLNTTNESQTVVNVGGDREIQYNDSSDNWVGLWFEGSDRETYDVTLDANGSADNTTFLCLEANETDSTLTLHENASDNASVAVDGNHTASHEFGAGNLDGWIDEVRVFASPLSKSERSEIHTHPTRPLPNADRAARMMLDEGSGTDIVISFSSKNGDLSNGSWVDGHDGVALEEDGLLTSGDYERTDYGLEILESSEWFGAPRLFVDASLDTWSEEAANRIASGYSNAISLVDVIFLVFMAGLVLVAIARVRSV